MEAVMEREKWRSCVNLVLCIVSCELCTRVESSMK